MGFVRKISPVKVHEKFESVPFATSVQMSGNMEYSQPESFRGRKGKVKVWFAVLVFVLVAIFSLSAFLSKNSDIGKEVQSVVEKLFEPRDIGKIKFASGEITEKELESEALSKVQAFGLPFYICVSKNLGDTFLVSSAGEITVRCAMKGVVESIETNKSTFQKTITIKHQAGLKTVYSMVDNVSVKVGDVVEKNTILGISYKGEVGFKVNFKDKIIKGLEIVDGQLSFV